MNLESPNLHTLPLRQAYRREVEGGHIESDPAQLALVAKLDELLIELDRKRLSTKSSSLGWLFGRKEKGPGPKQGLYIWGDVGRGKSMLMDMFFAAAPNKHKRRVHFNDFMQDAQTRIHEHRKAFKEGKTKEEDPIPPVARELAREARLLCFDEFSVTDIADAMILGRLFSALFASGVTVVATSNVAPENLYHDGLNRALFLPFIELLKEQLDVIELNARTDFRLEKLSTAPVYYHPLNGKNAKAMDKAWIRITGNQEARPETIELKGRTLPVPKAALGCAWFSFQGLCEEPRSAADYLAIARKYHTIFLDGIKIMSREKRNEAKRFILLIDTLYDNRIRLVASAEGSPEELYPETTGTEAFEFQRTISRLHEMQSADYIG